MVGNIILIDNTRYRIIGNQNGLLSMIEMDTNKFSLRFEPEIKVRQNLRNNIWIIRDETPLVIDLDTLSEKEKQKFTSRREFLKNIISTYGPMFDELCGKRSKPLIKEAEKLYELSRATIWKLIRTYLQNGMNDATLVNKNSIPSSEKKSPYNYTKRPGRKSEDGIQNIVKRNEVLTQQFDAALAEFKKGRESSLVNAYDWLLDKFYSEELPSGELRRLPDSECPTINQFYYYARQKIGKEEMDKIKTSFAEQRNNKRLLFSSSRIDAVGPGRIMEVDAWEADVKIISEVDDSVIGKPIVYFGIDVYSSVISAMSVSLENNSMVGITNLLLNLSDDKHALAGNYDFTFDDGLWPSNYFPQELRCDRGAEFKSNEFGEVCHRLGINRTLVSGASGSLKGMVEQSFHQFKKSISPSLESKGLITYRYDDNSRKTACMKLRDFIRMTITFVVSNNVKPIADYPMDTQMIREGLITSPCAIWEYGCRNHGAPTPITKATSDQFLFNVMPECVVSISRRGVCKEGLFFRNNDPDLMAQMYTLGNKHGKFTVRYDPRDASSLFYLKDGHIETLWLNTAIPGQEDFIGMTWKEVGDYTIAKKKLKKAGEEITLEVRSFRRQTYDQIVNKSASQVHSIPSSTEIRKNRAIEKQRANYDNRIAARMAQHHEPEILAESNALQIPAHPEPKAISLSTNRTPAEASAIMLSLD